MHNNWLKGSRPSEALGRQDAKTHREIPGYPVGSTFKNRDALSAAGVHAPLRAGIHGTKEDGAYSIVLSYGYEDDVDDGETFIYTGEGGRDSKSSKMDKLQGKETWDTEQRRDQEWVRGNLALKISCTTHNPVRVIRGAPHSGKKIFKYAPAKGYQYDGLYIVTKASRQIGETGFRTCQFVFERSPDQEPLPTAGIAAKHNSRPTTSLSTSSKPSAGPSQPPRVRKPHIPAPPYRPPNSYLAKIGSKYAKPESSSSTVIGSNHSKRPREDSSESEMWEELSQGSSTVRRSSPESSVEPTSHTPWSMVKGRQKLPAEVGFKKRRRDFSDDDG